MTDHKILVIDDDEELCALLRDYLGSEGFEVACACDAKSGLEQALSGSCTMVVLDVMLPGMSGFEVLRLLRKKSTVPVLMLTARGDDVDRIVGLEMGADDYLAKPFNPREMVARIRAIQRRTAASDGKNGASNESAILRIGDVELDSQTRTVSQNGAAVHLTSAEFSLLEILLNNAGSPVAKEKLTEEALGRKFSPLDRSVDVHIASLRKKLGHSAGKVERIATVRGVGYQYAARSDEDA